MGQHSNLGAWIQRLRDPDPELDLKAAVDLLDRDALDNAHGFAAEHCRRYIATDGRDDGWDGPRPILILYTTGRTSGATRRNPLLYFEHEGRRYLIASYGGAPKNPAWFDNLSADPDIHVRVMDEVYAATARVLPDDERAELWPVLVAAYPMFGEYEQNSTRQIPVVEVLRSVPDPDDSREDHVVEQSRWVDITRENPDHSTWYIERFRAMEANGDDLGGEARFIDTMAPRKARILDAGCGPGRVGALLAASGHDVVGVDVDPVLIEAATTDRPGPHWLVGDLALLDLPARGIDEPFDLIACVGNVVPFLAPSTRRLTLANLGRHLAPGGRLVVAFGSGRGYEFDEFFQDATSQGLRAEVLLESFDLRPFTDRSTFLVAVLSAV